jgi:hypothetical protein
MPKFNILYLVETNSDEKTDNRIIILYDGKHYYYYGTRSPTLGIKYNSNENYIEYFGKYNEQTIVAFLKNTNDLFRNRIDTELHFVEIDEYEYDELTFVKLYEKMTDYTEIFAYDKSIETEQSMKEKLEMLKNF